MSSTERPCRLTRHTLLALLLAAFALPASAGGRLVALLEPADLAPGDAYLRVAEQHYRGDPTVLALTRVASLTALHRWLVGQAEVYGPVQDIVLVGHGSAWTGVAIDLHADGPRATVSVMLQARASGAFPALPAGVLDPQAIWRIDSCAAGRQRAWLQAFASLWQDHGPVAVTAASDFVVYEQSLDEHGRLLSRRFEAPVGIDIFAAAGPAQLESLTLQDPAACAPLAAPCEQRRLPIRAEYLQLGEAAARRPRRRPQDGELAAALADLNLRPAQLRWRIAERKPGATLWLGEATAVLRLPLTSGWQVPFAAAQVAAE